MKSFSKFCLMLAGIFVILGIVGVTAGMALGARPSQFLHVVHYGSGKWMWDPLQDIQDWKEDASDWKEDALDWKEDAADWKEDALDWMEDIDEDIAWGDDLAQNWKNYSLDELGEIVTPSEETVDNFEGIYGDAGTRKLELELNQSIVRFYSHEGEGIQIRGANAKKYLKIATNGDTLTLTDHRKKNEKPVVLEIYLPKQSLEKLEIDLDAALFYAGELTAEKIDLDMGAGTAELGVVRAEKLEMDLGAGMFTVEEIEAEEKAILGVGTGEMTVQRFTGSDLELGTGVGRIFMVAEGKESDYDYELSCGIGGLNLNGREYSGLAREKIIDNHASKKIVMECGIGSIELEFEE